MFNFLKDYFKGYFINGRLHFPDTFNSNIAFINVIVFGLTSLVMFFFYEPLAYLFFLIMLTSTESDANISGNPLCNKIVQKLDIIVILITIVVLYFKLNIWYCLFLIPIVIVHHWKRDAKNPDDYEIKMNIWHCVACVVALLTVTIYTLGN